MFNKSKRQRMIYIIIALWTVVGLCGFKFNVNLTGLATYFASLTGFVGVYVWGETKRPSGSLNDKSK